MNVICGQVISFGTIPGASVKFNSVAGSEMKRRASDLNLGGITKD